MSGSDQKLSASEKTRRKVASSAEKILKSRTATKAEKAFAASALTQKSMVRIPMTPIDDLIKRLREMAADAKRCADNASSGRTRDAYDVDAHDLTEAADALERMKLVLEPFARSADDVEVYLKRFPSMADKVHGYGRIVGWTLEHAIAARRALEKEQGMDVGPTAEAIEEAAEHFERAARELRFISDKMRSDDDITRVSEAVGIAVNTFSNIRLDLFVTRPIRALRATPANEGE